MAETSHILQNRFGSPIFSQCTFPPENINNLTHWNNQPQNQKVSVEETDIRIMRNKIYMLEDKIDCLLSSTERLESTVNNERAFSKVENAMSQLKNDLMNCINNRVTRQLDDLAQQNDNNLKESQKKLEHMIDIVNERFNNLSNKIYQTLASHDAELNPKLDKILENQLKIVNVSEVSTKQHIHCTLSLSEKKHTITQMLPKYYVILHQRADLNFVCSYLDKLSKELNFQYEIISAKELCKEKPIPVLYFFNVVGRTRDNDQVAINQFMQEWGIHFISQI